MGVSLYTVRVVLNTLGAVDYGIYNVVAGVVTMFSFLSGAMATASQRYFSFDLGKKDYEQLKKTFSVSFTIYVIIALVVVLLAETIGLWFVYNKLVIPPERVQAARWIYQASIVSFVFTILTTPYMASIIAHEDMTIYAYVSIVEVILKLGIVFLLPFFSLDKLMLYGLLMAVVVIINTTVYRTICRKKYEECRAKLQWDTALFTELLSYTGWNLFGAVAGVFKLQGTSIILNQFCGPIVNASRAIAFQINSAVNSFSQNFSMALKPQIVKNFASHEYKILFDLLYRGCKFTFFLMFILTVPVILNLDFILKIWLVILPENVVTFSKLVLIESLIESLSYPMSTANQATGKIKKYQILLGTTVCLNLPISYLLLKLDFQPNSVFIVSILLIFVTTLIRTFFLNNIPLFSLKTIFLKVYLPVLLVVISITGCFTIINFHTESILDLLLNGFVELLIISVSIFFLGLNINEKKTVLRYLKKGA